MGKWGLGNKSALSLGINSYTVINRYNGRKFRFEVSLNNVLSTTPKFSNGSKNNSIVVSVPQPEGENGAIVNKDFVFNYEETSEFNGLELVIPIKKHEKKKFFNAVEEQLMYIPNIIFKYKELNGIDFNIIDVAAKVLYRDDNIVISETTLLNYPHILLGTGDGLINYGAIDFEALELEPKHGAVGLVLDINTVEVTPSRETVVWSSKTRNAVISSYNKIVDTATKLINKELNEAGDYWEWIQKAGVIKNALVNSSSSNNSVLEKLSGVIDATSINKIYYTRHSMNKLYTQDVRLIIGDKLLVRIFSYDSYTRKISRTKIKSVSAVSSFNTYITAGASNKYKDRYIYEILEKGSYLVIKKLEFWESEKTSNLIGKSSVMISYDDVIVPEDMMDFYLKEELDSGVIDDEESISISIDANKAAKLRKLEEKIIFHTPQYSDSLTYYPNEIKISNITKSYIDKNNVIYGNFNNRALINSVLGILPIDVFPVVPAHNVPYTIRNVPEIHNVFKRFIEFKNMSSVTGILISDTSIKYIKNKSKFIHVSDFIIESYRNNKLIINSIIRLALTFNYISKILTNFNISVINRELILKSAYTNFYEKEFIDIQIISEYFKTGLLLTVNSFFNAAIQYELNKNNVDISTTLQYLKDAEDKLPDELCDNIDEIEDIHIVDVELINKTIQYCKFYSKYNPILHKVNYADDLEILNIIKPLINLDEEKPEKLHYFQ